MRTIFWVSLGVIAYVYVGYPLLAALWARVVHRRPRKAALGQVTSWPSISIVVAARNEAVRLPARVANLLDITYPGSREVIVVSDGSTDDPAEALRRFGSHVRLIELPAGGKPLALNAGVAAATGEILVFADARQLFSAEALVEMVANLADPQVGGVTGELMLDTGQSRTDSTVGDGVGLYWRYEKWLRRSESLIWSTIGVTGAIYAMRRRLWRPLPADTLLDDVLAPMRLVLGGSRVVFEERARAHDHASKTASAEARRKVRTLAGNYQLLAREPRLLLPIANPVWIQFVSHKLGRLAVPWALVGTLLSAGLLAGEGWLYAAAFAGQAVFYGLAAYGGWTEYRARTGRVVKTRFREAVR